jgi:hypothetical protein
MPDSSGSGGTRERPPQKLDTSRARSAGRTSVPSENVGRRLHAGHFAFIRAVVQGVDTAAAWDRYLRIEGESSDGRAVRSTITWIRDEFAAAAQRHARFGVARLVRLDTARLSQAGDRIPSLEAFALDQGLEDFSEAEQLEAYQAGTGTSSGARAGGSASSSGSSRRWPGSSRWSASLMAPRVPSPSRRARATACRPGSTHCSPATCVAQVC